MGRFVYVHLGDEVPKNIEIEYNRLLRREQYQEERDVRNGMIYTDFDDVLAANPDPESLCICDETEQEQIRHRNRLNYLPIALELLRAEYQEGYELIQDYYLSDNKVSMRYLAVKYSMTMDKVRYRIRIAKEKLKEYITLYENE